MKMDIKVKTVLKYMTMLIGGFVICVLFLIFDESYGVRADEEIWEIEDNDSPETANEVPLMTRVNGQVMGEKGGWYDEKDYYSFTIHKNGCVWLSFSVEYKEKHSLFETNRAYISIFSKTTGNGVSVFGNWDRNTLENDGTSKKIGLKAGTYFFCIEKWYKESQNYSFQINYEESSEWESEKNDTILEATQMSLGTKYFASLGDYDDVDYYSFNLTDDGYIWLSFEHDYVDSVHSFDTEFYNSLDKNVGKAMWSLDSSNVGDCPRIGLSAGTYYFKVDKYIKIASGGWVESVVPYSFTVNFKTSDRFEKEPNNSIQEANEIVTNKKYYGSSLSNGLYFDGEYDYYKFKIEKKGKIRFSGRLDSVNKNDPNMFYDFYDSDNNWISIGFDRSIKYSEKETSQSLIDNSMDVSKGDYYLFIGGASGNEYSFTVEFSEDGSFNDINEKTEKQSSDSLKKGSKFTVKGIKYKTVGKDEVVVVGVDSALETVKIPATVTVKKNKYAVVGISKGAFKGNKKITRVTIKADLDKIGDNAFSGCKKLKRIDLLGNISEIGRKAFYKCTNLKQIYITTENIKKIGKKAFTKTADKATVKVPAGKVNAYKKMLTKAGISKKALIK